MKPRRADPSLALSLGLWLLLAGIALACAVAPASAEGPPPRLTILTEEFPPFNFTEGGRLRGLSTDILVLMLADAGIDVPVGEFRVLPWARAYNEVLTQPGALLYSVTRTPEREKLFKWVGPIAPNRNVLLARSDRNIEVQSLPDAFRYRVGAIKDDAGAQLLLTRGFPREKMDLAADAKTNLRKLDSGRIDMFAYPETVLRWVISQAGGRNQDYRTVLVLHDGHVYFALHKDTPAEVVDRLQAALDRLAASGRVQEIIDSYVR